jgi:cell division septal protein FtsQ
VGGLYPIPSRPVRAASSLDINASRDPLLLFLLSIHTGFFLFLFLFLFFVITTPILGVDTVSLRGSNSFYMTRDS